MGPPTAVLFDMMGTLVEEPFYEAVPGFFGMSLEELRKVKHPTSWIDFEKGLIDEDTYIATFFTDGRVVDVAALKRAMYDAYGFIDGVEQILIELKARGTPMFALSNYSPWYELIEEKLHMSRYVDWRFVSCRIGRRKPEPEAYLGAARELGRSPSECVFVDDRRVNCDAARELGMCSILFRGAPALRHALADVGLVER